MIRAHIRDDWMMAGVGVVFVQQYDGQRSTVWAPGGMRESIITDDTTEPNIEPLRLRDEEARALLAGLLSYYQGGDDTRALRKDYDAERARVDKLIDATIARAAT